MSETCCYCGGPTVYPHRAPGIDAERGYHDACHPLHGEFVFPVVLRAEIAALKAAHDAAMAEADCRLDLLRSAWRAAQIAHDLAVARADAAEAQLAQAREDAARSAFAWYVEHLWVEWDIGDWGMYDPKTWESLPCRPDDAADLLAAWRAA